MTTMILPQAFTSHLLWGLPCLILGYSWFSNCSAHNRRGFSYTVFEVALSTSRVTSGLYDPASSLVWINSLWTGAWLLFLPLCSLFLQEALSCCPPVLKDRNSPYLCRGSHVLSAWRTLFPLWFPLQLLPSHRSLHHKHARHTACSVCLPDVSGHSAWWVFPALILSLSSKCHPSSPFSPLQHTSLSCLFSFSAFFPHENVNCIRLVSFSSVLFAYLLWYCVGHILRA